MHSRSPLLQQPGGGLAMDSRPGPSSESSALERAARRSQDVDAPATMIVRNRADYLGEGASDIGQRIGPDKLELFVGTDAAQAMQQQIVQLAPEYIALHDVGTSTGLRLLSAIGTALGSPLQQLAIRRQGYGVPLATLRFVEVESRGKRRLRVYSTDIDADSQSRRQLARVLLGQARLAVLMVGELPSHALDTALAPLRDALREGPWPNRKLIMVPLSAGVKLAEHAARLPGASGVDVTVTAPAARPTDAWSFIAGAWNRARQGAPGAGEPRASERAAAAPAASTAERAPAAPAVAATAARTSASPLIDQMMSLATARGPASDGAPQASQQPASAGAPPIRPGMAAETPGCGEVAGGFAASRPSVIDSAAPPTTSAAVDTTRPVVSVTGRMPGSGGLGAAPPGAPAAAAAATGQAAADSTWERYISACQAIRGLVSACVFDLRNAQALAHTGGRPDPERLVAQGMVLYTTMAESSRALGLGGSQPDATITLTQHILLLHPLPGHPGIAMHAVLDGSIADPTLARAQLRRVDTSVLAEAAAASRGAPA